jgi:uncharacterized membrane protein YkvA (DUF1232 family)
VRYLLIGLGVALAIWLLAVVGLIAFGRRAAAKELATLVPNLVVLFRGLIGDSRVPRSSKVWLWVAVVWIASPVDLIPEFVPVAGPLDDAIVAALALRHLVRRTAPAVVAEHWRGDPATLDRILRRRVPDRDD